MAHTITATNTSVRMMHILFRFIYNNVIILDESALPITLFRLSATCCFLFLSPKYTTYMLLSTTFTSHSLNKWKKICWAIGLIKQQHLSANDASSFQIYWRLVTLLNSTTALWQQRKMIILHNKFPLIFWRDRSRDFLQIQY